MSTTGSVQVTAGSGTYVGSYTISEDAVTKNLQRAVLSDSSGTEIGNSTTPVQVSLANTASNATAVKVDGSAVTQPVSGTVSANATPVASTTIYNGKKTVTTAGTRVTLAASQAVKSVVIKALSTNTGFIYVGDGSVASTTGFQLQAGETVSLDIANLATVNLDSSVNAEGVTYIGTN